MAETTTSHFGWTMPDPGASPNTWGATLNATTQKIDAQVFANQQAGVQSGVPVGSGALWFAATPPANWLICDGSSLDTTTYAALFAIIGTKYGSADASHFNLPNLLEAFPLGAGVTHALAATGGEATHLLTTAEIPAHTHPASQAAHTHTATQAAHSHAASQDAHAHGVTVNPHAHGANLMRFTGSGGTLGVGVTPNNVSSGNTDSNGAAGGTDAQQPAVHIDTQQPAITVVAQTPAVTVSANTGGGATHNNLPPFLAISFIIKYK